MRLPKIGDSVRFSFGRGEVTHVVNARDIFFTQSEKLYVCEMCQHEKWATQTVELDRAFIFKTADGQEMAVGLSMPDPSLQGRYYTLRLPDGVFLSEQPSMVDELKRAPAHNQKGG